jgi:hypothetical protein
MDMASLLDSVRGTVQGMLTASRHVLWYVDWQSGGSTVREAPDGRRTG